MPLLPDNDPAEANRITQYMCGALGVASLLLLGVLLALSERDTSFVIAAIAIAVAVPANVTGYLASNRRDYHDPGRPFLFVGALAAITAVGACFWHIMVWAALIFVAMTAIGMAYMWQLERKQPVAHPIRQRPGSRPPSELEQ